MALDRIQGESRRLGNHSNRLGHFHITHERPDVRGSSAYEVCSGFSRDLLFKDRLLPAQIHRLQINLEE